MPAYRFFLDLSLEPNMSASLPKEEAHHITRVMRCPPGSPLEIVNGRGDLAHATLTDAHTVHLHTVIHEAPPPSLILIQALPKLNRLDFIVEKGTELGMTELWLFPGERSEKQGLSTQQRQRLTHLSIAALKQCGRLTLPQITLLSPIATWTHLPNPTYFGSLSPSAPWLSSHTSSVACVIGPEAGLSPKEEAALLALHALPAKLHSHILRTDTAALVALTLLIRENNNRPLA